MTKATQARRRAAQLARDERRPATRDGGNKDLIPKQGVVMAVITSVDIDKNEIGWRALKWKDDDPDTKILQVFGDTQIAKPAPTTKVEQFEWMVWNSDPTDALVPAKMTFYRGNWHPEIYLKSDVSPYTADQIPVLADF